MRRKTALVYVYLFSPENSTIDSRKMSINQEGLVAEGIANPRRIAFSVVYRLVDNILSHSNELTFAWSAFSSSSKMTSRSEIFNAKILNEEGVKSPGVNFNGRFNFWFSNEYNFKWTKQKVSLPCESTSQFFYCLLP